MTDDEKLRAVYNCIIDVRDDIVRLKNILGCNCSETKGPLLKLNALLRILE